MLTRTWLAIVLTALASPISAATPGTPVAGAGALKGKVQDENGKPVANAEVEAKNTQTGAVARTHTTTAGDFEFARLPSGVFDVTVRREGLYQVTLTEAHVVTGGATELGVPMRTGKPEWSTSFRALALTLAMPPLDAGWAALQAACGRGSTEACLTLGGVHHVAGRPNLAVTSYQQACDQQDGLGCLEVADLALRVAPADYRRRGVTLLEKACDAGDADRCAALASVTDDRTRAAGLLAKACARGSASGCLREATGSNLPPLPAPETVAALENVAALADAGCSRGHGRDCLLAGLVLEAMGSAGPKSRQYLLKACELGQKDACEDVSRP